MQVFIMRHGDAALDADSETACVTLNSYPDTQESIRAAMAADTSLSAAEKETVEHLYFSGLSL